MPLNLASPGIVVKEVDLTIGRVDTASEKVGAIVGPFAKGPVNVPVLVENEQDLLDNFGEPHPTDKHYEYWMTAASFLSYGGPLRVVRSSDADFKNGFSGTAAGAATSIAINSVDDYNNKAYDENIITGVSVVAKNPGSWSNGIKVAIIDGKVDQTLMGIDAASPEGGAAVAVGYGVTQAISAVLPGAGSTSLLDGYLKGIVTEVDAGNNKIGVKVVSHVSNAGTEKEVDYQPSGVYTFSSTGNVAIHTNGQAAGYAVTSYTSQEDWFDQQTITLTNSTIQWNQIADRPSTSAWASARGARHDELHVVVYDDAGTISGNSGTLLEKHISLSKASDGEYSVGSPSHWRKFLASNSEYIFGGDTPGTRVESGFSSAFTLNTDDGWNQGTGDGHANGLDYGCLLYTSDAADE